MHMISKEDLSDAEMDSKTKSWSPTIVITANGELQSHEEAIVYVKELDIFLKMKVLENTPAVLLLGKLFDENGYSNEWINGQKPHLIKDGIRIICNTENFVPTVFPGLTSSSSTSSSSLRTLIKLESHSSSSSSSSSPSSPTVGEMSVRERYAGGIWKGDVLIADLEELETMDASEIYSKRLNAKEVIFPKEGEFSNRRWTNRKLWRRSGTENTHLGTASTNSRR